LFFLLPYLAAADGRLAAGAIKQKKTGEHSPRTGPQNTVDP
jgi:hypothetical protein